MKKFALKGQLIQNWKWCHKLLCFKPFSSVEHKIKYFEEMSKYLKTLQIFKIYWRTVFLVIYGSHARPGWVRWVKSDRHLLYEIRTAILSLIYGPVSLQISPEKLSCSEPFPLQTHTFSSIKWHYNDGHGLTMRIIFFSHNGFWFPPFGNYKYSLFPSL